MEICGFEIAKKLKDKGFREECFAYYDTVCKSYIPCHIVMPNDEFPEDEVCIYDLTTAFNQKESSVFIDAPTISQVLKWLREEKKISIEVGIHCKGLELDFNVEQTDYWEKLKHQYAGMAMQGMFANPAFENVDIKFVVLGAVGAATELIKKLKEEEKCKE